MSEWVALLDVDFIAEKGWGGAKQNLPTEATVTLKHCVEPNDSMKANDKPGHFVSLQSEFNYRWYIIYRFRTSFNKCSTVNYY